MPAIHEIVTDEDGNRCGTDGQITVTLLGMEGKMFKRRSMKAGSGETCWLVAELHGVKVYQYGNNVVITDRDLYP
jgi:hypothetical protein